MGNSPGISEIIRKILSYFSEEDDVVSDPFLGSGQVAVVSKAMNRRYFGYEINPKYYEFAKKRLDQNAYRLKPKNEDNFLNLHPSQTVTAMRFP